MSNQSPIKNCQWPFISNIPIAFLRQCEGPKHSLIFPLVSCSTCSFSLGNCKTKLHLQEFLVEKSWLFLLVYLCFPFTTSPSSRVLPLPPLNMRLSSTISDTPGNKLFLESQFIPIPIAGLKLWVFFPLPPPPFFSLFFFFFNARNRLNWHFRMLNCTFSWALWFVEIYQKWQDSTSRRCLVVPRSSRNSNHRNKKSLQKKRTVQPFKIKGLKWIERCCADQHCPSASKKVSLLPSQSQKQESCPSFQLHGLFKCHSHLSEPWRCTGFLPFHLQKAQYSWSVISSSELSYQWKEQNNILCILISSCVPVKADDMPENLRKLVGYLKGKYLWTTKSSPLPLISFCLDNPCCQK